MARGETRKTVSQQINEANTKLADFLSHHREDEDVGDNLMIWFLLLDLMMSVKVHGDDL